MKFGDHFSDCLVCGAPLVYHQQSIRRACALCGDIVETNVVCEAKHFVCDRCHSSDNAQLLPFLRASEEKDPIHLFLQVAQLPFVHLHGPEHHSIVPAVLLTAYHNNGGTIDLERSLAQALQRGYQVPGGSCGFWGVCGAAAGAGIYASIVTGSTPLNTTVWTLPQHLTSRCLDRITAIGGSRCCKRTARLAIETAVEFTREHLGISLPLKQPRCTYSRQNRECIGSSCPFFDPSFQE